MRYLFIREFSIRGEENNMEKKGGISYVILEGWGLIEIKSNII
jgi:hypothetical protein